jgi:hypothetical protein
MNPPQHLTVFTAQGARRRAVERDLHSMNFIFIAAILGVFTCLSNIFFTKKAAGLPAAFYPLCLSLKKGLYCTLKGDIDTHGAVEAVSRGALGLKIINISLSVPRDYSGDATIVIKINTPKCL